MIIFVVVWALTKFDPSRFNLLLSMLLLLPYYYYYSVVSVLLALAKEVEMEMLKNEENPRKPQYAMCVIMHPSKPSKPRYLLTLLTYLTYEIRT